jgi:hypothetical protein
MALLRGGQEAVTAKPTVADLGIDLAGQAWRRSGYGDGTIEVAFAPAARGPASLAAPSQASPAARGPASPADRGSASPDRAEWVLMRVTGDPEQRVLVFDRNEWECFLDGARNGEFDDAAARHPSPPVT